MMDEKRNLGSPRLAAILALTGLDATAPFERLFSKLEKDYFRTHCVTCKDEIGQGRAGRRCVKCRDANDFVNGGTPPPEE